MPLILDAVRAYATLGEMCNALKGVSDDHFTERLNDRTNSMQWLAGHLAHSRTQMARLVDAEIDADMSIFGEGIDESAEYPSRDEIVHAFEEASRALRARLQDVNEVDLARPAPMQFPINDSTIGGAIAFFTEHEGYHIGQLGFLRKAHGYEAVSYA